MSTAWDTWWVVGHCNASSAAVTKAIDASMLPLPAGAAPPAAAALCCFDVHNEEYLGGLADHGAMATPPLDASLWRIWRFRPYPFVGTPPRD